MVSNIKWNYKNKNIDKDLFARIKEVTGSGIIANLLINRGVTCPVKAKEFLSPNDVKFASPDIFEDMPKAVSKINKLIESQEHIIIFGDFDADGVTSTSLLYKTLKFLGANVGFYIPDRADEGHGLSSKAVLELISKQKAKLIITVDCGITNVSEVNTAKNFGTDVIITDHHEAPEEIPQAFAIINPKILDEDPTGLKYLAGVGVAFKLAEALLESHGKLEFTEEILPLVAIGTIGDVVPLLGENRGFVHKGLELIMRKKPIGIAKLLELAGHKPDKAVSSGTVAFGVVPRINAIGRLASAETAVKLLVSEDCGFELDTLADELDSNNKERQQICEDTFREAEQKIYAEVNMNKDRAIILADESWHPGIIGIVASKLVEKYYRPALLLSVDENTGEGRCSARSIEGLNLFETLSEFSEYFMRFGGHALAAGFSFSPDKISFEDLRKLLLNHINKTIDPEVLQPSINLDMDVEPADLTIDFINELDRLAPYGESNPYPLFGIKNLALRSCAPLGAKRNHLKIMLSDAANNIAEAVWWQRSELDIDILESVDVAFTPSINSFRGNDRVQLVLKDLRRSSERNAQKIEIPEEIDFTDEDLQIDYADSDVNWVDHRHENGFKKDYLEYLNSFGDQLGVFAESPRALTVLDNIPFLKPRAFDRLSVKKVQTVVFLDFPADDMTFMNIIKQSEAGEVHLFGIMAEYEPVELVKKVSGMLRYADKEKNGIVNIDQAASVLAVPQELFLACVELLDSAGVLEINEIAEINIKFKFTGSANFAEIQKLDEYQNFIRALQEFENYKQDYKNKDIALIKETINNCCMLIEAN